MSAPRLAGRLSADLVLCSPQGFNAVKDYAIDLRGTRRGGTLRVSLCACALPGLQTAELLQPCRCSRG